MLTRAANCSPSPIASMSDASIYSPDGRFIVTGSMDGLASLWDAASGKNLSSLNRSGGQGLRVWRDEHRKRGERRVGQPGRASRSDECEDRTARLVRRECESPATRGRNRNRRVHDRSGIYGLSIEPNGFTVVTVADGRPVPPRRTHRAAHARRGVRTAREECPCWVQRRARRAVEPEHEDEDGASTPDHRGARDHRLRWHGFAHRVHEQRRGGGDLERRAIDA